MARPKSFLQPLAVDRAKRSHDCQHDSGHRIAVGESRLKLKVGRAHEHYCAACAISMIDRDIEHLTKLRAELQAIRQM